MHFFKFFVDIPKTFKILLNAPSGKAPPPPRKNWRWQLVLWHRSFIPYVARWINYMTGSLTEAQPAPAQPLCDWTLGHWSTLRLNCWRNYILMQGNVEFWIPFWSFLVPFGTPCVTLRKLQEISTFQIYPQVILEPLFRSFLRLWGALDFSEGHFTSYLP